MGGLQRWSGDGKKGWGQEGRLLLPPDITRHRIPFAYGVAICHMMACHSSRMFMTAGRSSSLRSESRQMLSTESHQKVPMIAVKEDRKSITYIN